MDQLCVSWPVTSSFLFPQDIEGHFSTHKTEIGWVKVTTVSVNFVVIVL